MTRTSIVAIALIPLLALGLAGAASLPEAPPAMAAAAEHQIVLSFAGDCTLGTTNRGQNYASGFVAQMAERGFHYPFSGVRHIFAADDLTLVNLEGTFTDSRKAEDKPFVFRAPPDYARILVFGSVEAVNLANNHTRDFGERGYDDTRSALDAVSVLYSGNGELAVYEAKGVKIGMTGYSYPHWKTLEKLEVDIAALKEMGCELIVVSLHGGTEESYKASGQQKSVARGAIDLGADIVVGHHPHVLQGVEVYNGKPIFYSLGNFSFGGNVNPKDWDTMIAQVVAERTDDGRVRLVLTRLIPCLISGAERYSDFRPVVADDERAEKILQKLAKLSPDIDPGIFADGWLALPDVGASQ